MTILYNKEEPWVKKDSLFDVTMGSYDGAESCELVVLFILSKLQHLDLNIGLYRDDGLAISQQTPQKTEKMKKEICRIFKGGSGSWRSFFQLLILAEFHAAHRIQHLNISRKQCFPGKKIFHLRSIAAILDFSLIKTR